MNRWFLDENGTDIYLKCTDDVRWHYNKKELVRILNDLETKLAESEKKIDKARKQALSERQIDNEIKLNCLKEQITGKEKRITELKQQLAEKEKENLTLFSMLYETLEKQGCENITSSIEQMTNLTLEKQSNWFKENCVKNQDKISFAVEQLEKVLKTLEEKQFFKKDDTAYCVHPAQIAEYINNQINELKEGK